MIVGTSLDESNVSPHWVTLRTRNKVSVSVALKYEHKWRIGGLEEKRLANYSYKSIRRSDFVFEPRSFGIVAGTSTVVTSAVRGVQLFLSPRHNSFMLL
jgi:hypothetical protein